MKVIINKMITVAGLAAALVSCSDKAAQNGEFKYLIDEFADLKIMRYQVPGWDALSLQQKEYVYHLSEAAKYGRDIIWMQNCKYNLQIRKALENILENYEGDRTCEDWTKFETYAKRVFFSNGIHHHYAEDKFFPECSQDYFHDLMAAVGEDDAELEYFMFDPGVFPANAFIGNYLRLDLISMYGDKDDLLRNIEGYFYYMAEKTGTLWENDSDFASCNHGFASHVIYWFDKLGMLKELE